LGLSLSAVGIATVVWLTTQLPALQKAGIVAGAAAMVATLIISQPWAYAHLLEKLHYKEEYAVLSPYKYVVQNRDGIVAVVPDECDLVYGGGFYDGAFNIDPVINTNRIRRAYMTACLHPDPKQVLEIGLSSGSWAQVLASYSKVKELTIVEINPGYL